MKLLISRVALLGLGLSLGACGVLQQEEPPDSVEENNILLEPEEGPDGVQVVALDDASDVDTGDLGTNSMAGDDLGTSELAPGAVTAQGTVIHFGYDSTEVSDQYREIIQQVAARLQANPSARLRLEGHTDERGTRAYNLALGERRAQSVRDMVLEEGALAEQVDWVSYGEEVPAVMGQGEAIWKQNRRVEIVLDE